MLIVCSPLSMQDISTIAQNGHDYTGSSHLRPPIEISLMQTVEPAAYLSLHSWQPRGVKEPAAAAHFPLDSWQPQGVYDNYNQVQARVVTRVRAPEVSNSRNPAGGPRSPPFSQELSRFPAGTL